MTRKEFKIQKVIGTIPKDSKLTHCKYCGIKTPHVIIGQCKYPKYSSPEYPQSIYTSQTDMECYICHEILTIFK
jgi:hypothetical protein